MNFTREPIIETVITPKDGNKLVVRNSKVQGQEEYFVDAVEIVSFGKASFFRSLEKPKCFLVPVSDYEILEAREARMVLKTPTSEKGIKIAGGRESPLKVKEETSEEERPDKRRERKRSRRRRGKDEGEEEKVESLEAAVSHEQEEGAEKPEKEEKPEKPEKRQERTPSMIIPPPSTLISETISRYKTQPVEETSVSVPPPDLEEGNNTDENDVEEIPF